MENYTTNLRKTGKKKVIMGLNKNYKSVQELGYAEICWGFVKPQNKHDVNILALWVYWKIFHAKTVFPSKGSGHVNVLFESISQVSQKY